MVLEVEPLLYIDGKKTLQNMTIGSICQIYSVYIYSYFTILLEYNNLESVRCFLNVKWSKH